jgi:hypothetical protein
MSRSRLALVVLGLLFLAPILRADSQVRIVRVSYLEGDVQIDRRDGDGFERAFLNMPVTSGTKLRTRDDGRAEVEFEDGSTIRLVPSTRLEFTELARQDSGRPSSIVNFQEGTAYFNLRGKDKSNFSIQVGLREIRPSKSTRFRLQLQDAEATLAVFKGELKVAGGTPDGWLEVRKNETLSFDLNDADRHFLAKQVSPDRYDDWNKDREEYRDRYASSLRDMPYGYGVSDLNYYGNYLYVPPYGYVWRPALVSAAWNPFADGAWVWYPGFGYTWVSGYPWGWVPYHYGSWLFLAGYGWCWQPRVVGWSHWNNVPNVVDPPPGFTPPRPPAGGGGGVVVVGRGPRTGRDDVGSHGRPAVLDGSEPRTAGRGRLGTSADNDSSPASNPGANFGHTANPPRVAPNAGQQPAPAHNNNGDIGRFGGHRSDPPQAAPAAPSARPRSAPSAPRSTGGSAPAISPSGRSGSSMVFGGVRPSSGGQHSGSHPRSSSPR